MDIQNKLVINSWLLFLFLLPVSLVANEHSESYSSNTKVDQGLLYPKSIMFNKIQDEQGRSIKYTYVVVEDIRGLVWIGTRNELIRFDGNRLTRYQPKVASDTNESSVPIVADLYSASADKLYLATSQGLLRFNPSDETFVNFNSQDSNKNKDSGQIRPIRRFIKRNDSQLWLARKDSISLFDLTSERFIEHIDIGQELSTRDMSVMNLAEHDNKLWIATFGKGLLQYDLTSRKITSVPLKLEGLQLNARNLLLASDLSLWLGTQGGLLQIDITTGALKRYNHASDADNTLSHDNIGALFEDEQGRIWVGSHFGGVNLYQPHSDDFIRYATDSTNPVASMGGSILSIKQGPSGTIYVGGNSGVEFYHPDTFAFQYQHINVINGQHLSVEHLLASNDQLYVTSNLSDSIAKYTFSDGQSSCQDERICRALRHFDNPDEILELYPIEQGVLLRTHYSIFLFNWLQGKMTDLFVDWPLRNGYAHPRSIFSDSNQRHYVYAKGGVYRLDGDKLIQIPQALGRSSPYYTLLENDDGAAIDSKDTIWSLWQDNLHGYNVNTGQYQRISLPLSKRDATGIFADSEDNLWISTTNQGILFFNQISQVISQIKQSASFGHSKVMFEDKQGEIWASSQHGLLRLSAESDNIFHYGRGEGLPSDNMKEETSVSLSDNYIALSMAPGANGFVLVDTRFVRQDKRAPNAFIEHLKINGKATNIRDDSSLNITEKIKRLEFTMTATHPFRPDLLQYQYQLLGFDSEPVDIRYDNSHMSYTNLGPGNYTIAFRAKSKSGVWSPLFTVPIVVHPAFWQTWWAKVGYLLLSAAFIMLVVKLRTWKLRAQKVQLQHQVRERTHQLQHALRQSQLLYTSISHEFRTPLTLILGPLAQLKKELSDVKTLNSLDIIDHNAKQLLKLVDQLLSLAKLKVSDSVPSEGIDVKLKLSAIVNSLDSLAKNKQVTVKMNCRSKLWLTANVEQFEFIMLNLITNSIRYTPPAGTILIDGYQENKQTVIKVSDTGIGIAKEHLDKIFDPFYRVDTQAGQTNGAGIGLLIVKEFVTANQGKIRISSQLGEGSEFTLNFPPSSQQKSSQTKYDSVQLSSLVQESISLESELTQKLPLPEDVPVSPVNRISTKSKLLIVEDNEQLREYMLQCFNKEFEVILANNGEEGLKRAEEEIPALILSDVMMPVMDGITLCNKLYHLITTQHIPVILLTAKNDPQTQLQGMENKAIDFISKPFDVDTLALKIKNIIDFNRRQQLASRKVALSVKADDANQEQRLFIDSFKNCCQKQFHNSEFNVSELASEMAMSVRSLQRVATATVGQSPSELLRNYRLNRAHDKLTEGLSVTATYLDCGFKSASYFSRAFKELYGHSPSQILLSE